MTYSQKRIQIYHILCFTVETVLTTFDKHHRIRAPTTLGCTAVFYTTVKFPKQFYIMQNVQGENLNNNFSYPSSFVILYTFSSYFFFRPFYSCTSPS